MTHRVVNMTRLATVLALLSLPASLGAQDRMKPIPYEKLTDAQKAVVKDGILAPGSKDAKAPMSGTAHYLIRIPELMNLQARLVDHALNRTVLPSKKLGEMATLLAAREHTQQFQWANHAPMARKAGLSEDIITAIAEGRRPEKMTDDEATVYDFSMEVYRTMSVSDATYDRTVARFGEPGVIDLLHYIGTYQYLGRFQSVLRHPLPPGQKPELAVFPRNGVAVTLDPQAPDRMQGVPFEKLTDAQKKALREGTHFPGMPGGKAPMAASAHYMIHVPELMPLVNAMSDHVRQRSVLQPDKLNELAILLSAREFTQQFQWYNHYPMAKKAGLSEDIITAIAEGRRPATMADDEATVYDFCVEVYRTKSLSDATYNRALAKFGEAGIIELLHIQGTYQYLAGLFNVLRHPLLPGQKPALMPYPRNQ